MERKYTHWICIRIVCFTLVVVGGFTKLHAQAPTWTNEGFSATPYPASANYFLSNAANSWTFGEINGTIGFPNKWVYTIQGGTTPTYPTTTGGFLSTGVTVANHAQYAGAGYLQYNNRSTNMPTNTNVAPDGDAVYIATRALDFSGHTTYNAAADTFGFWFYRDPTATGLINGIADSIVIYLNTTPVLQGPNLAKLSETVTGSSFIPRSSTIAPVQGAVGGGWRRCTYTLPNMPAYIGTGTATSTAYIIIVTYSHGGGNMLIDDINLPEWPTPMQIQQAVLYYQENADVNKNTTGNLIMGVRITTTGSSTPIKLDAATFSTAGSTSYANDVQNPLCYYSGASANFSTTGGVITMPYNAVGPLVGLLNFGWYGAACVMTTPATMQLSPGTENYVWLTYDIKLTATTLNYVAADFQFITSKSAGTCYYAGAGTPNVSYAGILPQTQNKARRIDVAYAIPTYTAGLGVPGYADIDCVSAVYMPGDNGTQLQNYDHDDTCSTCVSVYPIGTARHPWCVRWACHPNDYTNFAPVNVAPFKNRFIQITKGRGVRTTTAPYLLRIQHGDVPGRIGVFIDWNKDGDFDDTYNGVGGLISESYGTHAYTGSGSWSQYPVTTWPTNSLWNIDVPDVVDVVTDLNDATQPPNYSTGPLMISNVRMRIRQTVNAVTVHPYAGGYTEGETEDYTLQVLDACPVPGYNICKWIGNSSDWNTISNWCPGIPTINDMAYIPIINTVNYNYPTIQSNTPAVCRQLKLMDNGAGLGAKLFIDAPKSSSLVVADDVIIGQNAPAAGSNAGIYVNSIYNKTVTIPGASTIPPLGSGVTSASIFQQANNLKFQIGYSAAELATTFGWQPGDIIDAISMVFQSTTGANMTINNFRIVKYEFTGAMSWTNPATADADICVRNGYPTGATPVYILGTANSGVTLNVNAPNTGTGSYTINLIPNSFIWNGNDLALSFEWWSPTPQGSTLYRNYYESSSTYNVFAAKSNTGAVAFNSITSGFAISGYNATLTGAVNVNITGAFTPASYCASNLRPRLDFALRRPYTRFDFTIGGKLINNNKFIRTVPYGLTPVYNIAGDSGFVGGFSKVIFDPSIRPSVSTPGFPGNPGLTNVNTWNPVAQGQTLLADIDQEITSVNLASTSFTHLEINKVSASGKVVKQNSTVLSVIGASADTLSLVNGELYLNRKYFTLRSPSASSLSRVNGWIKSEDIAGNMQSIFIWNIGTNTGIHDIPFGTSITNMFPFRLNLAAGDVGSLSASTFGTPQNNTTYPTAPTAVTTMLSQGVSAVNWTVDRFWNVKRTTNSGIAGSMRFNYPVAEGTAQAAYSAGNMRAQRYEQLAPGVWGWALPYPGQSDGNPGPTYVDHDASYLSDIYNVWTIVSLNNGQTPLPVELVNFDAHKVEEKVKIWWDVQSEHNVASYKIERTIDKSNFSLISQNPPYGNSTGVINYETFDEKPLRGLQYYRLTTTNTDGSENYSDLKPVDFKGNFEILNIAPDAKSSFIDVTFYYNSNLPYQFVLTDLYGKVIATGSDKAKQGVNEISIPVQLAKGLYFFTISNSEKALTQKLIY